MFFLVGLGLGDAEDITVKGLNIVRKCKRVYLEAYTSILTVGKAELEKFYGREVILADREMVEQQSDEILNGAQDEDVAFLVVGDPFGATTHSDMVLRATERGVDFKVIHNASIMNAIGCCGLQLYSFGETISIVLWTENWRPDSFYDKIARNRIMGMHTLCLLDIKVKEQTIENLMRGNRIFEPPRFMSVNQAADQLLEIVEDKSSPGQDPVLSKDTVCVAVARVGSSDQVIRAGTLEQMKDVELGPPLHSLVITGHLHPLEVDMLKHFKIDDTLLEHLNQKPS